MVKGGKKYKQSLETFEDVVEEFNQIEESESESEEIKEYKTSIDKSKVKNLLKNSQDSIGNLRKLLKLYRASCHISEDNQSNFDSPSTLTFSLTRSLKKLPRIFKKVFNDKSQKQSSLTSYKNLFRSYLANTLFLLKQVAQETLLADIFSSLSKVLKFFKFFPELIRGFMKNSIKVWSESGKIGKLVAYQFIRRVLMKGFFDKVVSLKLLYVQFTKNSKFMNWSNYLSIETMRKCFVDLLGIDLSASYQVVFASLRQLSMFLSQTVKNPSSDRIKTIYNWQFLNSFIIIGQSIMTYKDLWPLVHPLVQIATGILSLTNISKYYPLKLHLLRVLINIESHCEFYIPSISPNICEILTSSSLSKSVSTKKLKDFSFIIAIKTSKDQQLSQLYREQLVDEATECLIEHFSAVSQFPAFPEMFLPVGMTLKKYCKGLKNLVFRQKILHALRMVQETVEWILEKRKDLKDLNQENRFLGAPLVAYCEKILKRRQEIVNSKLNFY
jgi:nucleolar complex protein 2